MSQKKRDRAVHGARLHIHAVTSTQVQNADKRNNRKNQKSLAPSPLTGFLAAICSIIWMVLMLEGLVRNYAVVFEVEFLESRIWIETAIAVGVLILIQLQMKLQLKLQHRFRIVLSAAVVGYIIAGMFFYSNLLEGAKQLFYPPFLEFQRYYRIAFSAWRISGDSAAFIGMCIYLAIGILLYLGMAIHLQSHPICVALPGILLLMACLMVGKAPDAASLFLYMMGLVPAMAYSFAHRIGDREVNPRAGLYGSLLSFAGLLMGLLVCQAANDRVGELIESQHDSLLGFQRDLEDQVKQIDIDGLGIFGSAIEETGEISNHRLHFTDKEIFTVSLDKKPETRMYFRGYVGDVYEDGNWSEVDEAAFAAKLAEWEVSADFGRMTLDYSCLPQTYYSGGPYEMTLTYPEDAGEYAYVPYFTYLTIAQGDTNKLEVDADAVVRRKELADKLTLYTYLPTSEQIDYFWAEAGFMRLVTTSSIEYNVLQNQYYRYVMEHYTQTPTQGLERLSSLAAEWADEGYENYDGEESYTIPASKVIAELSKRTTYSQRLGPIPMGVDVVENFLFDSKQGYCIHYASAATLLLRKLGVPARYVTGYAVNPSEFEQNEDGSYSAVVPDRDGHAWVEVYQSMYGWVPIEVTRGAASEEYFVDDTSMVQALTYRSTVEDTKYAVDNPFLEEETGSSSDEAPQSGADPIDTELIDTELIETELAETEQDALETTEDIKTDAEQTSGGGLQNKETSLQNFIREHAKLMCIILALLLVLAAVMIWRFVYTYRQRSFERGFYGQDTRRIIRHSSYVIRRELCRAGICPKQELADAAYEQLLYDKLVKEYHIIEEEQLRAYFKVLYATMYSEYEPMQEEAALGRTIYRQIRQTFRSKSIDKK